MRPRGPLPPRVYWTRRLVLLAVIVLVAALLWWLIDSASGAGATQASSQPSSTSSPGPTRTPDQTTADRPDRQPSTPSETAAGPTKSGKKDKKTGGKDQGAQQNKAKQQRKEEKEGKADEPAQTQQPLAQPSGPCDPSTVDMKIDVSDVKSGHSNPVTFHLTSLVAPACRLGVTADSMVVKVTSGSDVLWSSAKCPESLPAKKLVVRSDPPTSYQFTWSGHREQSGCGGKGAPAAPGGYWVKAALVGGEPHKAYFDVR